MESKKQVEEKWLRCVIIPELIKNHQLTDNTETDKFKLHSMTIQFIGNDETFMLTTCYKAKIEYEFEENRRVTRSLVVKKTPDVPEETFNSINFPALFSNEINGYTFIMPEILKFSKHELNLPKYYYGNLEKRSATIILEDFSAAGWQMTENRYNLSVEHALLAVKYLATFHGVCYALKNRQPDLFVKMTRNLKESRYATETLHPDWLRILSTSVKRAVAVTRSHHPEVPTRFLQQLERLISDHYRYGKQRVQPVEPLATLCHGDYLRNNVAYKYDELSRRPIDVMMFDLQTMRYSSPMLDLAVFLALSVFSEVRVQHFEKLFSTYCDQLKITYEEHTNQQLPQYLSSDGLLNEYIRFLPYSIAVAASFLMTLVEPYEVPSEQMLRLERSSDEIDQDTMKRGGVVVDQELAHQVKEVYDLSKKHQVDICEGFVL